MVPAIRGVDLTPFGKSLSLQELEVASWAGLFSLIVAGEPLTKAEAIEVYHKDGVISPLANLMIGKCVGMRKKRQIVQGALALDRWLTQDDTAHCTSLDVRTCFGLGTPTALNLIGFFVALWCNSETVRFDFINLRCCAAMDNPRVMSIFLMGLVHQNRVEATHHCQTACIGLECLRLSNDTQAVFCQALGILRYIVDVPLTKNEWSPANYTKIQKHIMKMRDVNP